jgi:photosystem II stability/assembly factor-like uncharacterized protein
VKITGTQQQLQCNNKTYALKKKNQGSRQVTTDYETSAAKIKVSQHPTGNVAMQQKKRILLDDVEREKSNKRNLARCRTTQHARHLGNYLKGMSVRHKSEGSFSSILDSGELWTREPRQA